jgi:PKD repeat protein
MLVAVLAVLALGCLAAPAAFAAPNFTWIPTSPVACELVTFTPSDVEGQTVSWEYDGVPAGDVNTHTFTTEATHSVTMDLTTGPSVTHNVVVGNAPPVSAFDFSPTQPDPGESVMFDSSASSDCDDSIDTYAWDFDDGATSSEANPVHSFATPGSYDVTLTVEDQNGAPDTETVTVTVRDPSVPTAAFHRDPGTLLETGQQATFTSDSAAAAGSTLSWEIDGVAVGSGPSVTHSFATSGNHVVRLMVVQPNGESDDAVSVFRVNAPPVAGFVWSPGSPVAGGVVQLFSTSMDTEGTVTEAWDLDGDGAFDDASGSSATASFGAGGHNVSLRVTDGDGVSRVITRAITVSTVQSALAPPKLMSPFPTVRLVGVVVPRGARITLVEVRGAPRGARVTVRCTGGGCPWRLRRRVVETGRVRLSNFTRVLVAGARIQVFVRAPGVIGKYVGFRIRAGKRPVRTDRCLMPGASEPTRCT